MRVDSTLGMVAVLIAGVFLLSVASVAADTYRWKDKDGKVHYGATVPPEYAEQPYDILNKAGIVIEHVEDTSAPLEVVAEKKVQKRKPLISDEERQFQSDRLLLIQYRSEEEINQALNLEVAQLGYDSMLVNKSYDSTGIAIRGQIRKAADQQRANLPIRADQKKEIDHLYARRIRDENKLNALIKRENRIRARFQTAIERYRFLTSKTEETDSEQVDQS
jgi:hypothetical protein